jgi:hypothetical protein
VGKEDQNIVLKDTTNNVSADKQVLPPGHPQPVQLVRPLSKQHPSL